MDGQSLVVGLQHRAQIGISVDATVIQRLQRPDRGADQQRGKAPDQEREHRTALRGKRMLRRQRDRAAKGKAHDGLAGSTMIRPVIAWCSMPQYSLQMM